jgi:hypothetical protein
MRFRRLPPTRGQYRLHGDSRPSSERAASPSTATLDPPAAVDGVQRRWQPRRGSTGGRPVRHDETAYRRRDVIEPAFNGFKH